MWHGLNQDCAHMLKSLLQICGHQSKTDLFPSPSIHKRYILDFSVFPSPYQALLGWILFNYGS